jgi:trans-2,3-dihydro-3-hydroxyanthranilate isomerase
MKIPFYIVDVFTERRFSGNQLAVISGPSNLSSDQMQDIAREMHFSETTFINPAPALKNHYPVRIFTPEHEVPFAGHPVLGTAFVIREEIMERPSNDIILDLSVGSIPVSYILELGKPPMFWMKQNGPVFGRTFETAEVAKVLTLPVSALDIRFPIEEVSTGLPVIIVPVRSLAAVKSARINTDAYQDLIDGTEAKALHIFCPDTYDPDHTFNARMFGPYYGILEDPATGSANGCLAAYLYKHRYFQKIPQVIMVEQGYEIHRPSLISCRVHEESGKIMIEVGGTVIMVARGEIII